MTSEDEQSLGRVLPSLISLLDIFGGLVIAALLSALALVLNGVGARGLTIATTVLCLGILLAFLPILQRKNVSPTGQRERAIRTLLIIASEAVVLLVFAAFFSVLF